MGRGVDRWGAGGVSDHSCQPLLGINLSPEFVNLYFFAGGSGILNSNWHVWQWKEEAMLC